MIINYWVMFYGSSFDLIADGMLSMLVPLPWYKIIFSMSQGWHPPAADLPPANSYQPSGLVVLWYQFLRKFRPHRVWNPLRAGEI